MASEPVRHGSEDLTLELVFRSRGVGGDYEVTAAGAGRRSTALVPVPQADLAGRALQLGRSIRDAGDNPGGLAAAGAEITAAGRALFAAVFTGEIQDLYRHCVRTAEEEGVRLEIVLSFGEAPELAEIPWETLYDDPLFLATQRDVSLIRSLSSSAALHPVSVRGMVRVLGVISSPTGLDPLDADGERRQITAQLERLTSSGLAEVTWLDRATVPALLAGLDAGCHVLHYIGHSDVTPAGDGVLILEQEDGTPHPVSGAMLANMIGRRTSLRLVVLNSCKGARTVMADPGASIAGRLVALGIPAVVAMQFSITDKAAVAFGSSLYRSLIELDRSIDEAVADARLALLAGGNDVEWAIPVLFRQGVGSDLFDLSSAGWYTLNGQRPARTPEVHRPGFLGFTLGDTVEQCREVLGPPLSSFGGADPGTVCYQWTFQEEAFVTVTVNQAGALTDLAVAIDGDDPGRLRVALPYGLVLGESTMRDTARVGTTPTESRAMPEMILMVTWNYQDQRSAEGLVHIEFGFSTAVGRLPVRPDWFSETMDVADRLITSCRITYST